MLWLCFAVGSAFFAGITAVLAKIGMQKINSTVNQEDLIVTTRMTLLVDNLEHLNLTLANLRKVSHVVSVERVIQ